MFNLNSAHPFTHSFAFLCVSLSLHVWGISYLRCISIFALCCWSFLLSFVHFDLLALMSHNEILPVTIFTCLHACAPNLFVASLLPRLLPLQLICCSLMSVVYRDCLVNFSPPNSGLYFPPPPFFRIDRLPRLVLSWLIPQLFRFVYRDWSFSTLATSHCFRRTYHRYRLEPLYSHEIRLSLGHLLIAQIRLKSGDDQISIPLGSLSLFVVVS